MTIVNNGKKTESIVMGKCLVKMPGSRQSTTRMADLHVHVVLQECVIEVVNTVNNYSFLVATCFPYLTLRNNRNCARLKTISSRQFTKLIAMRRYSGGPIEHH